MITGGDDFLFLENIVHIGLTFHFTAIFCSALCISPMDLMVMCSILLLDKATL